MGCNLNEEKEWRLFSELEEWSKNKDAFSINGFLKERRIEFSDFESMASNNEKLMKMWGVAEGNTWENIKEALYSKSLPRSQIGEYLIERGLLGHDDPESLMRILESTKQRIDIYERALSGDTMALLKLSLNEGKITQKEYDESAEMDDEDIQ